MKTQGSTWALHSLPDWTLERHKPRSLEPLRRYTAWLCELTRAAVPNCPVGVLAHPQASRRHQGRCPSPASAPTSSTLLWFWGSLPLQLPFPNAAMLPTETRQSLRLSPRVKSLPQPRKQGSCDQLLFPYTKSKTDTVGSFLFFYLDMGFLFLYNLSN